MLVDVRLQSSRPRRRGTKEAGYFATLLTFSLLAGCATGGDTDTQTSMRGAAAEYCESIGGEREVQETRLGSGRYCRLPDGRVENEWQLYSSERLNND